MRYEVLAKQYKAPGHLVVRLDDGRVLRAGYERFPRYLKVGDTGKMVQGRQRPLFKPDAIDFVSV